MTTVTFVFPITLFDMNYFPKLSLVLIFIMNTEPF